MKKYILLASMLLCFVSFTGFADTTVMIDFSSNATIALPSSDITMGQTGGPVSVRLNWLPRKNLTNTAIYSRFSSLNGYLSTISISSNTKNFASITLVFKPLTESLTVVLHGQSVYRSINFYVAPDAVSPSSNWVRTRSYTSIDTTDFISDVTYYDGLGMPEQTIAVAASPTGKSVVTPYYHDAGFRTDARTYLQHESPYNNGMKDPSYQASTSFVSLYGNDDAAYAFSQKTYDSYASNRPISEMSPGKVFRDAGKKRVISYQINQQSDNVLNVTRISDNGRLSVRPPYATGLLSKTVETSPDGNTRETYKDKNGKTILLREYNTSSTTTRNDTYYVYDKLDRLIWIITPEGSSRLSVGPNYYSESDFAAKYATVYRYDGLGRVIAKRLPGCGWSFYIYDKKGRLVLEQDPVRQEAGKWFYHIYDNNDREIARTIASSTSSRAVIQSYYDAPGFDNTYPDLGGNTDWRIPVPASLFSNPKELMIVRYGGDHYRADTASTATSKFTVPSSLAFLPVSGVVTASDRDTTTIGMKIYERYKVLGAFISLYQGAGYVERAFYYDKKGRVIQVVEKNAMGGISRTSTKYDYMGHPLIIREAHRMSPSDTDDDWKETEYAYDDRGRLISESASVNGGAVATVDYSYDAASRLTQSTYGNGVVENRSYTAAGWLQNESVLSSDGTSPLFSLGFDYWNPTGGTGRFGGNITALRWRHGNGTERNYLLNYDLFGRLSGGAVGSSSTLAERSITYDKNGNILSLERCDSTGTVIADLLYSYDGNFMNGLTNGADTSAFTYDSNGNMLTDSRRRLYVSYNELNLPNSVVHESYDEILGHTAIMNVRYSYLADGTKVFYGTPGFTTPDGYIVGGYITLGSMRFKGNISGPPSFESTDFAGGIIRGTTADQIMYCTRDHLGSARVLTDGTGAVIERNDYYPFGERMATGAMFPDNRWRFSGKEDQKIGTSGWLDFGARMYDTYTARWTTQDPLAEKYPSISPYAYCAGDPVNLVDPDGKKLYFAVGTSDTFKRRFAEAIQYMNNKGTSYNIAKLEESELVFYIGEGKNSFNIDNHTISWDPNYISKNYESGIMLSPLTSLAHEAGHASGYLEAVLNGREKEYKESAKSGSDDNYSSAEERRVITTTEQYASKKHGELPDDKVTRTNHEGHQVLFSNVDVSTLSFEQIINFIANENYKK